MAIPQHVFREYDVRGLTATELIQLVELRRFSFKILLIFAYVPRGLRLTVQAS